MRVGFDWRNTALPVAFAIQDFGNWLSSQGRRLEEWLESDSILGCLASTWADSKARRHILPVPCDDERALCGMEPGLFGWENHNNLHSRDLPPGVCVRCMERFYSAARGLGRG